MASTQQVGMSITCKWWLMAIACLMCWVLFFTIALRYPTQNSLVPVAFTGFFGGVVLAITCIIYASHVFAHLRIGRALAALPDEYIHLRDIRLSCGNKSQLFSHLVVAPSGVWLVKVLPGAKRVHGNAEDAHWSTYLYFPWELGKTRWRVFRTPNPFELLRPCRDRLHDVLQQEVGADIPTYLTLIYPGTETHITADIPIVNSGEDLVAVLINGKTSLKSVDRERVLQVILGPRK